MSDLSSSPTSLASPGYTPSYICMKDTKCQNNSPSCSIEEPFSHYFPSLVCSVAGRCANCYYSIAKRSVGFIGGRPCRYCCIKKRQPVGGTGMNSLMSLQLCNIPTSFFSVHDCTTQFMFRALVFYQQGRRRYVTIPRDLNRSNRFLLSVWTACDKFFKSPIIYVLNRDLL